MSKLIYLDSCVILSYLRGDAGRADIVESVFSRITRKELDTKIYTSALTIIEVTHLSGQKGPIDPTLFPRIDEFWRDSPITVVELNAIAAKRGREVMRERLIGHTDPNLPAIKKRKHDLSHLGTALWLNVDELWTYDPEFTDYPVRDLSIVEPHTEKPLLPGFTL